MYRQDIEIFMATNASKFPEERIPEVRNRLNNAPEQILNLVYTQQFKDPSKLLLISLFAGKFGVDRFMLDQVGLGLLKLFTCGGCGIWTIVDFFTISRATKEYNFQKLDSILRNNLSLPK